MSHSDVSEQIVAKVWPPDYEWITKFTGIKITDGKPSKLYRVKGNNFRISIDKYNWHIETKSGRIISAKAIKAGDIHLAGESFRIVPDGNDIVALGIKVVD
jgi:hypothetical protein